MKFSRRDVKLNTNDVELSSSSADLTCLQSYKFTLVDVTMKVVLVRRCKKCVSVLSSLLSVSRYTDYTNSIPHCS